MMQAQGRIKLNRRGLTELVLACAFLSLLTLAMWSWQVNGGHVAAMEPANTAPQNLLLPKIMNNPTIMITAVIAQFIMLLSLTLALVPPAWWLRADHILGTAPVESTTLIRWLGHKIQPNQPEPPNAAMATNAAGEPIYYEVPGAQGMVVNPFNMLPGQPGATQGAHSQPGQYAPGLPVPGQTQPGQMQPGQMQPGQMQPGQPVAGQGQPMSPQPATMTEVQPGEAGAPPPAMAAAPISDVLNFEVTEEDDPLADLANIGDILNSAFDEDAGVDADLEALSSTLDEVEILALLKNARNVLATFQQ